MHYTLAKKALFTVLLIAGGLLSTSTALALSGKATVSNPMPTARRVAMQAVCTPPTLTTSAAAFQGDYIIGSCAATDTLYYAFGSAPDLSDPDCARVTDGTGTPTPGGGNISVDGASEGDVLYVVAWRNGNDPSAVATYTIHRYTPPTVQRHTSTHELRVTNGNTGYGTDNKVYYTTEGNPTLLDSHLDQNINAIDCSTLTMGTTFQLRVIGDTKFPSARVNYSASRFARPNIVGYIPYREAEGGVGAQDATGTVHSDPGTCIYINTTHFDSPGVLTDPNPFDASTYDVKVTTGSSISLQAAEFKMVAASCTPSEYGDNFTSMVNHITPAYTGFWAMGYTDGEGVTHYMSFDPDNLILRTITQFDNTCLWMRDNTYHDLYYTREGVRYYLTAQGLYVRATNTLPGNEDWALDGNHLLHVSRGGSGNTIRRVMYSDGEWMLTVLESGERLEIRHDVQQASVASGSYPIVRSFTLDSIASTAEGTATDGFSNHPYRTWLAFDSENESYSLSVYPTLILETRSTPTHKRYYFVDDESRTHEYFVYANRAYTDVYAMPSVTSHVEELHPNANITYDWNVSGDAAPYFVSLDGTNSSQVLRRNNTTAAHPLEGTLQVTAHYDNNGLTADAESAPIALFAESVTTLTYRNNSGTQSAFADGQLYLLANYGDNNYTLDLDGEAVAVGNVTRPSRVWRIRQTTYETHTAYTLYNELENKYLVAWNDTAYNTNRAAAHLVSPGDLPNASDHLFVLTPHADDENGTSVTLQPYSLAYGRTPALPYSLAPTNGTLAADAAVRQLNSDRSWYQEWTTDYNKHYNESQPSAFYLTRWQLQTPHLAPPIVSMDPEGVVTLTSITAGPIGLTYGTDFRIVYQVNEGSGWGGWLTYDPDNKPELSQNHQLQARIEGMGSYSYLSVSAISETFTARKVMTPVPAQDGNDISFTCDHATDGTPVEGRVYYTVDGSTPDEGDILYTAPSDPMPTSCGIMSIGFADNCLKSDVYNFTYDAQLNLTVSTAQSDAPYTVTMTVDNSPSLIAGTHYKICYTLDGTTPTASSTEYDYANGLTIPGYAFIKAKAFPLDALDGHSYSTSTEQRLFVGEQLYAFTYVSNGGNANDTNALLPSAEGEPVNSNVPHTNMVWTGPRTAYVNSTTGDLFYNAYHDAFLAVEDEHYALVSTPVASHASLWIYGGTTGDNAHTLRTRVNGNNYYVVFDPSLSYPTNGGDWIATTTPNGSDYQKAVAYRMDTIRHAHSVVVTPEGEHTLQYDLLQPEAWDATVAGINADRYPMDGNWASLRSGDVFQFRVAIDVAIDEAVCPEHLDCAIYRGAADNEVWQNWHYSFQTLQFYQRAEEFTTHTATHLTGVDEHTTVVWDNGSGNLGASGSLGSYFTYAVSGDQNETVTLTRNGTSTGSGPNFGTVLGVTVTYTPAGGAPINFGRKVGHIYAETSASVPTLNSISGYKIQPHGSSQYLSLTPGSAVDYPEYDYLTGERIASLQSDYMSAATWDIKTTRNISDGVTVYRLHNLTATYDSVLWHTLAEQSVNTKGTLYLYDRTSDEAHNWRIEQGNPFASYQTTHFDFMLRTYAGGYYTISPYCNTYGLEPTESPLSSQRLSLAAKTPAESAKHSHISTAYTLWGEGHNAAGPATFWKSRWTISAATLTEPIITMTPDGTVTFNHRESATLGSHLKFYYTTDGSTPTTSSSLYDPAAKPVLTYGQTLNAIAHLDAAVPAAGYSAGSSPVETFTPTKCATPVFVIDGSSFTFTHAEGDTVVYSINNGEPHWNSPLGTSIYLYDGESVPVHTGDLFLAHAFRTNCFESDLVSHSLASLWISPTYTAGVGTSTPPSITLAAKYTAGYEERDAEPGHYAIYWTTNDAADLNNLDPNNLPAGVHLYTGPVNSAEVFPLRTPKIFRAVAISAGSQTLYNASDEYHQTVLWGYESSSTLANGSGTEGSPYEVHTAGDLMTVVSNPSYHASGLYFRVMNDLDITGCGIPSIAAPNFAGHWDGNYKVITGASQPLFDVVNGAHIYNVILDNPAIESTTNANGDCGAICNEANGATVIWNSGIRNSNNNHSNMVKGTRYVGGLVGYLNGTSRVVNCYNYAHVSSTNTAGGIVGYQATASTSSSQGAIVFNCVNYGNVNATSVAAVVNGNYTNNVATDASNAGLNTYNYFRHGISLSGTRVYDASGEADTRFLNRWEFYRYILNSNKELCAWWLPSGAVVGKWVLDTAIAPYPIVKTWGFYYSPINPNYEAASTEANAYEGKKLGTLTVHLNRGSHGSGASSKTITLTITDMDTANYDYNYYKVQMPYYQDHFAYASEAWIVTGWDITSVVGGTTGTFSTSGDNAYNFADRYCTAKDIKATSGRVFAQGGYFNVPEGVTEITVNAHWANAIYLSEKYYDYTYSKTYGSTYSITCYGSRGDTYNGATVYHTIGSAIGAVANSGTVYDHAIVLVGNYRATGDVWYKSDYRPFTVMSVDEDNDHEPDFRISHAGGGRILINPVRFDFVAFTGLGMPSKVNATTAGPAALPIYRPKGHFEITETALAHFWQVEYDRYTSGDKHKEPLILLNGTYEQFVTANVVINCDRTLYIHVGGHAWFKKFNQGSHYDNGAVTYYCPVTATGGDYNEFYLSGIYHSDVTNNVGNVYLFANGGHFKKYASGGQTQINGNATVKADHILAWEFYGGGTNAAINSGKNITGNIDVTINNSIVGIYAGGPQAGDMVAGKTVSTSATNTIFGTYYGAGYGGTSISVITDQAQSNPADSWLPGKLRDYRPGVLSGSSISVSYGAEFIPYSKSLDVSRVARFHTNYASLSKANTNDVTSTLTDCTVKNNYYGAGFVGVVTGNVTSTLTNTHIMGSAFGAGNSATAPKCQVYKTPEPAYYNAVKYDYWTGYYTFPLEEESPKEYTWVHVGSLTSPYLTTWEGDGEKTIQTTQTLNNLGQVTGNVTLTIEGNSVIDGSVCGGGDEAPMTGNTVVSIKDNTRVRDRVFGGGNLAAVNSGTATVTIGENGQSGSAHRPYIGHTVYGGGNAADLGGNSTVNIYEGIMGSVYGGGNKGSVTGNSTVNVQGGFIGYTIGKDNGVESFSVSPVPIQPATGRDRAFCGVYGGGFGVGTTVTGTATVTIGAASGMNGDVKVYGSVYGGGEAGQVGGGYKDAHLSTGASLSSGYYYFDFGTGKFVRTTSGTALEGTDYYTYVAPTFDRTTTSVTLLSDGVKTVDIAGAVYGGGRGYYYILNEEGVLDGTEVSFQRPIAGAVYGNTSVTSGTVGQDTNWLHVGSLTYTAEFDIAEEYKVLDPDLKSSGAVFWEQNLYVYDLDNLNFKEITPDLVAVRVRARAKNGGEKIVNISAGDYDDDLQYYISFGRVSMAGGGERGPVFGSTAFYHSGSDHLLLDDRRTKYSSTATGGNCTVTVHSGKIGDVQWHEQRVEGEVKNVGEVYGDIFGGGLMSDAYGVTRIIFDGPTAWCLGDVYGGGNMGAVYASRRASESATTTAIQVDFQKGWARNVHSGNQLADLGAGCNEILNIGVPAYVGIADNDARHEETLVSESCYGGCGFSPSKGNTTVTMYSGCVGYVRSGYPINTAGYGEAGDEITEGSKGDVVPNNQDLLSYEGNVYGSGFGPLAEVLTSHVIIHGGRIRNGVFGGGELAAVIDRSEELPVSTFHYRHLLEEGNLDEADITYKPGAANLMRTNVEVFGGTMSMVCGGGRGYTSFLKVLAQTPGAIMGNARVYIAGGTVDSVHYPAALGGGCVYGGGLEGIVTGNCYVHVVKGTVKNRVFGGGRGFSGALTGEHADPEEDVANRSTTDAGSVKGNVYVTIKDTTISATTYAPTICGGVYGGGEGSVYYGSRGHYIDKDTVAIVEGNVTVNISAGTIGGGHTETNMSAHGSFAGGRIAPVHGYANIHVFGTTDIAGVFGGNDITGYVSGKNRPATSTHLSTHAGASGITRDTASTYVRIDGSATVGRVFGGGNGDYNYYGDPVYDYLHLSKPVQPSSYVDIDMNRTTMSAGKPATSFVSQAYGGGNAASVDTAHVYIFGKGLVDTVFGGGNAATVYEKAIIHCNADPDLTGDGNENNINYLFGGNNQATMSILPDVYLNSGMLYNVYGGGNAGAMIGEEARRDIFNKVVSPLSTYLIVNSNRITVRGSLYGGCNQARVLNGAYVDVRNTTTSGTPYGIENLYGGNDISDTVIWTRVDINGGVIHNLYGGGNGHYNYTAQGYRYIVTPYGDDNVEHAIAARTNGRPYVDTTFLNIQGGTINSNIYGGGWAGNCGTTRTVVNDTMNYSLATDNGAYLEITSGPTAGQRYGYAHISGKIFGGGEGLLERVRDHGTHVGNVSRKAITDLKHVTVLGEAYVYAGGNAGDVQDAVLTVHSEWNQKLSALYGGCYGSDVLGTSRVYMNCDTIAGTNQYNVRMLYGGNDFTGTVKKSILTVNNGKYFNVYGAGNGDYPAGDYGASYSLPNSEEPTVTFNNGYVDNNLYGGGDMGLCYKGDTTTSYPTANDYAHVVVNVHGGHFRNHIYCGAHGASNGRQLVYGLKQLNMDGGVVRWSIYGGSENVHDGYPRECISTVNTTQRPSTILNIVGGQVQNRLYGGGYLGNIYGSVYVNVGKDAVNDSPVWTNTYNGTATAYANYKPVFVSTPVADTAEYLMPHDIYLLNSIYNGSDWGEAHGVYIFNVPGFYGGESRILIDGHGYNTSASSSGSSLPFMDIAGSLMGSGTSTEGGDVHRNITLRNYGNWACPNPSKELNTIQRADEVLLDSVFIALAGYQDGYSAYVSPNYSLCRIDDLIMRDRNVIMLNSPSVYIGQVQFQHPDGSLVESAADLTALKALEVNPVLRGSYADKCDTATYHIKPCDSIDFCERISSNLTNNPYTNLIVDDGVYVDVLPFIDDGTGQQSTSAVYGPVMGYARLLSNDDYQAYFTARHKVDGVSNTTDGGFFSGCVCENNHGSDHELDYKNYGSNFRVWTTGNGQFRRSRHISIVAHANVDYDKRELSYNQRVYRTSTTSGLWYNPSLINVENAVVFINSPTQPAAGYIQVDTSRISGEVAHGLSDFAISTASIDLPPSSAGHYYTISSVEIDEENGGEMRLITATWDTNGGNPDWYYMTGATEHDGSAIRLDPNFTFGLMFHSGENFSGNCPDHAANGNLPEGLTSSNCFLKTVISGNANLTTIGGYHSDMVGNLNNVSPKLDVTLTYSTKFSQTLTRDVVFTLYEYDENGHLVSPIDMVVTISTVIKDFIDNEETVLAMYNDGFSDEYSRKLVLPASLTRRTLYLKAVKWEPTTDNADYFHMTTADALPADNVHFGLTLTPEEDITNNQTSNAGWTEINVNPASVDIFSIVQSATNTDMTGHNGSTVGVLDKMGATVTEGWVPFTENGGNGLCIGTLDGRYAAALNVRLIFDGMLHYPKDAVVGKVYLKFYYTSGVDDGYMTTLINVKTRPKGDTIYLASANSITRNGVTLHPFNWNGLTLDPSILPQKDQDGIGATPIGTGKSPGRYVQTFAQALHSNVYQDGDVIAIMDSVVMTGEENYTLRGSDYSLVRFIRYTGTHWQMPGKAGAYRGPLIVLRDNSQFTCYNTHFDGGGLTKVKRGNVERPARCLYSLDGSSTPIDIVDNSTIPATFDCLKAQDGKYYDTLGSSSKDTICAHGPIFMVLDKAKVVLNNKVTIANNFNAATGAGGDTLFGGAILVRGTNSKTPDVTLLNNVTIEKNVVNRAAAMTNHKSTGAVHLHQGKLELGSSHESSSVNITRNYYYAFGSSPAPYTDASASGTKYIFDPTHMASLSNVFLTRTPASLPLDPVMDDAISDYISYKYKIPASTRISVNKWFPGRGAHVRDTIEIANVTVAKQLWAQYAISNGNFLNDSVETTNENPFYHATLSPYRIYLQRCSTFQKQLYTEDGAGNPTHVLYSPAGGNIYHRSAVEYRAGAYSQCPDGVDTLIFNVCSGFYPYTFKWERKNGENWNTFRTYTTPYPEDEVLADATYAKAVSSNSDTTLAYGMVMPKGTTDLANHYRVTATNLLGCELQKEVEIQCELSTSAETGITYSAVPEEKFTDTIHNTSHHAKATRTYRGYTTSLVVQPAGEGWGTAAAYWDYNEDPSSTIDLANTVFCPGQRFDLHASPNSGYKFLMWDFDPFDNQSTGYIKPNTNDQIYAYFAPEGYWKDAVTTEPVGYETRYNGDVHITNENGLAWLISVVNGFNGQQIRSFYFDTVFIHDAAHGGKDLYDMKAYLWTPVGTRAYKFRGHFLADENVVIKGLIVDEPQMDYAGMFAHLDSAVLDNVVLQRTIVHGHQYVGGLAGAATHTKVTDCQVVDHNPEGALMSNITTNYASGGLIGKAEDCEMTGITTGAKFMGSAVYCGGIIGLGNNVKIYGTQGRYMPRLTAVYSGGTAGYITGDADTSVSAAKRAIHSSHVANNYVRIENQGSAQNVGGLVGFAQNTLLENNYVYGSTEGTTLPTSGSLSGGIGAELSTGVTTRNCYYAAGTDPRAIGYNEPGNRTSDTATFLGSGNSVRMSQPAYGTDNLVLALNKWVRQHPDQGFSLWRSDNADENQGYPVFGTPDIIPVYDTVTGRSCDYYEFDGVRYYESGEYRHSVVDSTEMVDSIYTLLLTIDSNMTTTLLDTIEPGTDYEGYGFYLTAAEIDLLRRTAQEEGSATVVVTDTLQTIHGCDSIVILYLTFHTEGITPTTPLRMNVYPNPTTHHVTVEATGMQEVEVYDAVSRRVAHRRVESDQCLIDLSSCAAGTYYLRVHTTTGTVIQKVIKR